MKTRFSALMMTFLMLVSLTGVAVSAAIPDGDGTNGIDRNPTPPEQDVSVVSRTYDPASVKSNMEVIFDSDYVRNSNLASASTPEQLFSESQMSWVITAGDATTPIGDSAAFGLPVDSSVITSGAKAGVDVSISGDNPTTITQKDVEGAQAITMTMQNWYGSLDRTTPHGAGIGNNNAQVDVNGCAVAQTTTTNANSRITCSLNADFDADASTAADGIETSLETSLLMRPSYSSDASSGWAIQAGGQTAALYFGVDLGVTYNASLIVNGVAQEEGNTKNLQETDEVIIRCSDAKCTEDDVRIGVPTAYNATGFDITTGLAETANIFNSSTRVSIYDKQTFKMTFGVDTSHQAEATVSGVLWDPEITIETNDVGMKMGKIHDGEMSWCDASWFLAKCSGAESFDGNSSDGVDGMIMRITLPLETFWSMAAWGGYDKTTLTVSHPTTDSCFNGQINTHIMTPSGFDSFVSKNSMLKYLVSGNYYAVGALGTADSSTTLGSNAADYCTGTTSGITTTDISLDALASITANPLLVSYNNGMYDVEERTFDFYVVVSPEVGTMNAGSPSFNVNMEQPDAPTLKFKHSSNYDPLAVQDGITRTTNSTNQTNPAFATPYVMHYSGITPSDNIIQGRDLVGYQAAGGDYGPEYQGLQDQATWKHRTDEAAFLPTASTPRSTIECGVAVADADYLEASIEIFTNTDTSKHTGLNESEWKAYGTRNSNSSYWGAGPAEGANTGNLSVDNKETNTGSSAVSYTGVFINGDSYKAVCTFKFSSYDVGAENHTTQTLTYTTYFSAAEDGDYSSGGGSDVGDEDDSWLDSLDGWDYLIVGIALAIIAIGVVMWANGSKLTGWFDDRAAMIIFGVGLLHAWASHHYYYDWSDPISEEFALVLGSAGYVVMGLAIYLYGGGNTTMQMRNMRYLIGGFFLIATGVPTALTGLLNVDSDVLVDVAWGFPVYDVIAGIGSLIGGVLVASGFGILFRREGMN